MCTNFMADIKRYKLIEGSYKYLIFEQGLWAIAVYRLGHWFGSVKIPVISFLLKLFAFLLSKIIEILTGITIPASAKIGKGFYVGHYGGVMLNSTVIMGENCSVGPGVVVGTRGGGDKGVPVLGDNVFIGVGAKVLGGVKIGNNVKIGANAVVVTDIPDNATAVGIPARILEKK